MFSKPNTVRPLAKIQEEIKELNQRLKELKQEKAEAVNSKVYVMYEHTNLIKEYILLSVKGDTYRLKSDGKIFTFINRRWYTTVFDTLDKAKEALFNRKKYYLEKCEKQVEQARRDFNEEIRIELMEEK